MENDYFEIGVVTGPHGVRGEVRVLPLTFDRARFGLLDEVDAVNGPQIKKLKIENVKNLKQHVILKFSGIDDRDAAMRLKKSVLTIPGFKALPLGEDEYYIKNIIGLSVKNIDGGIIGEITDIIETGANDVYAVKTGVGELLIPAVKKYILKVDVAGGFILADVGDLT